MSRKTKYFTAFGVDYKTTQYSAITGVDIMKNSADKSPSELLQCTSAVFDGVEYPLSDPQNIDKYVVDVVANLSPRLVYNGIIDVVAKFNFGFLEGWKPVQVPGRFLSNVDGMVSGAADPLIASIIQSDAASLRELEEYYSLEDAFSMMDIMTAKGLNEALAHEAATEEARRK